MLELPAEGCFPRTSIDRWGEPLKDGVELGHPGHRETETHSGQRRARQKAKVEGQGRPEKAVEVKKRKLTWKEG